MTAGFGKVLGCNRKPIFKKNCSLEASVRNCICLCCFFEFTVVMIFLMLSYIEDNISCTNERNNGMKKISFFPNSKFLAGVKNFLNHLMSFPHKSNQL